MYIVYEFIASQQSQFRSMQLLVGEYEIKMVRVLCEMFLIWIYGKLCDTFYLFTHEVFGKAYLKCF